MNFIFDTLTIDGLSAADIYPEQRAIAIADALEAVREGYEMFGMDMDPTQNQLDAEATVEAFERERCPNIDAVRAWEDARDACYEEFYPGSPEYYACTDAA